MHLKRNRKLFLTIGIDAANKSKVKNGNCKRIKKNKLVKTDGTGLKK